MITSAFDRAENIVGKGEIACTSYFSHFFNRLLSQTYQKVSLCGNGLTLNHTIPVFNDPEKKLLKHCGKGRKC